MENDSLTTQYKELARAIVSERGVACVKRTFVTYEGKGHSKTIIDCANEAIEQGGTLADTAIAILVYPALQWLQRTESLRKTTDDFDYTQMESDAHSVADIRRLKEIRKILSASSDDERGLRLEKREKFFNRCQILLDTVDDVSDKAVLRNATQKSKTKITLITVLLNGEWPEDKAMQSRTIRSCFRSIVQDMNTYGGERISRELQSLVDEGGHDDGSDIVYLYHNVDVLLKEYVRILQAGNHRDPNDPVLFAISTATKNHHATNEVKCTQACHVIDFADLIQKAIAEVEHFPCGELGPEMAAVLSEMVNCQVNKVKMSDGQLAVKLHMGISKFYRVKRKAYLVLGAVLWGCSANELLSLLC